MTNKDILETAETIKEKSLAYQACKRQPKKQILAEDHICPSDEFMDKVFEETASGLGFEYTKPIELV